MPVRVLAARVLVRAVKVPVVPVVLVAARALVVPVPVPVKARALVPELVALVARALGRLRSRRSWRRRSRP